MQRVPLSSASGLRPLGAFVVIAAVVLAVALRVVHLSSTRDAQQPDRLESAEQTSAPFALVDASGATIATDVPRFDLELSPRSMWQAHTPERMARRIATLLDHEPSAETLLASWFPDANAAGAIEVTAWDLSAVQAHRVLAWIESGGAEQDPGAPLSGVEVRRVDSSGPSPRFRLVWRPTQLLSAGEREQHDYTSAWRWGRHLASGLARALVDPVVYADLSTDEVEQARRDVWAALLPTAFVRSIVGVDPTRALALRTLLEEEGVSPWQMRLAFASERVYPAGQHELFGDWGFERPEQTAPAPRTGLELLASRFLQSLDGTLEERSETYHWLGDRTIRGQRLNGYVAYRAGSATPVIETTLDLGLQRFLRTKLEELFLQHRPALTMAMVVDVVSGDVLAVDSVEEYEVGPFAPVYHVFTTGSTMKIVTMASALEEGVVWPKSEFDVGNGVYRVHYPDGRPSGRRIREAQGAPTGRLLAEECLAFSVNAGLTQIGLRMEDAAFHGYLEKLHYGEAAGSGLGSERVGHLPPLPWSYAYTHASVSFGHEISTTLWQHVAALATIARGGVYRPLRVISGLSQGENGWELELPEGQRVFSEHTCELVRDMMRIGARIGTGDDARLEFERHLAASLRFDPAVMEEQDEALRPALEFDLGTKTGTAQKVGRELCVHVEMPARARCRREGIPMTIERFRGLAQVPKPHRNCYTSSICAFGSVPGSRELMVLVVAEEPRGKSRYGSDVAGPTAAAILAEALKLTRDGQVDRALVAGGFFPSSSAFRNDLDEPWREVDAW